MAKAGARPAYTAGEVLLALRSVIEEGLEPDRKTVQSRLGELYPDRGSPYPRTLDSQIEAALEILAAERAMENARTLHADDHAAIEALAADVQGRIVDLLAHRTRAANARAREVEDAAEGGTIALGEKVTALAVELEETVEALGTCISEREDLEKKMRRLDRAHIRSAERCRTLEEQIARLVPSRALPPPEEPEDGEDEDRAA